MKINIQIVLTLTLLAFSFAKTGSLKENTQANLLRRSKVASNSTSTAAATGVNHKISGDKNTFPNPTGNSVSKADLKEVKQVPKIPLSAALKELPYNEKV